MFNFKRRLEIKILKILQEVTFPANLVILWYNYFIFTGAQRSNNLIFLDLLREEKLNHVWSHEFIAFSLRVVQLRESYESSNENTLTQGCNCNERRTCNASGKCVRESFGFGWFEQTWRTSF